MKSIKLTLLALIGFVSMASAQQKATKKVVINTPSVQCEMCKDRIEKYMSREPGIVSVKVDYKKKTTTVSFLTDRNDIEQVKTAIANVGYDADDVTAEEGSYAKLPKCCKKPVEKSATPSQLP
jgi:mercuric ion binding protein